jgi:hypothetical protein
MRIMQWAKSRKPSCSGPVLSRYATLPHISHERLRHFIFSTVDATPQLRGGRCTITARCTPSSDKTSWHLLFSLAKNASRRDDGKPRTERENRYVNWQKSLRTFIISGVANTAILLDLDFIRILLVCFANSWACVWAKLASGITGHRLTKYLFEFQREF